MQSGADPKGRRRFAYRRSRSRVAKTPARLKQPAEKGVYQSAFLRFS